MKICEQIFQAFDNGKTLVFPSETSARSQLVSYLKHNPGKALPTDRAVSFDTYKHSKTVFPQGRKPVETYHRYVFASEFFNSRASEKLRYFVSDNSQSKASFAGEIAQALPQLKEISESKELNYNLRHDISLISDSYNQFLEENSLYEESFYNPEYTQDYTVFVFPETYKDSTASQIKGSTISAKNSELSVIKVFPNSLAEIRDSVRKILQLLENKIKPSDIALTVTDMNTYGPVLQSEGQKRGIVFTFMQGKSLSSYPSGRLFSAIKNVYQQDYDSSVVKSFVLDPVFPFKNQQLLSNMIKDIICCNVKDGGKDGINIKEKLRKCPSETSAESLSLFITLSDYIKGICTASSVDSLRKALKGFQDTFFVDTAWDETESEVNRKVIQRCMDTLDKLEELNIKSPDFYSLFCTILNNTNYVDQDKFGIKVYQYPLSCGIASEYHFVLGLDDVSGRIALNQLPFSGRLAEKETVQIGDFIQKAYCHEHNGLSLSCALESFTGNCVPPALFTENGKTEEITKVSSDSFSDEEQLWAIGKAVSVALPSQKEAFDRALNTTLAVGEKIIIPKTEKPYSISASSLSAFSKCPYRWMCQYLLKLNDCDFEPVLNNAKNLGGLLHDTYEMWFESVKTQKNAQSEEGLALLNKIFEDKLVAFSGNFDSPSRLYIERLKQFYSGKLPQIINQKNSSYIEDCYYFDKELEIKIESDKYKVRGFIDCIFKTPEGDFVLIDFKTGKVPENTQLALYAKALEHPVKGAFYSINDCKYSVVFNDEITLKQVIEECDQLILNHLESLEKNCFEATPGDTNCQFCSFSRICRKRYVIKC